MTHTFLVRSTLVALAAAMLAAGAAAACFSERPDGTTGVSGDAECRIPVSSDIVGNTQAIVAIRDFAFVPAEIRVRRGTRVTWVNCERDAIDPHTSTSNAGLWESGLLDPGGAYSRTFDEAGQFPYHCIPHPFMQATVVVE
jgi:plastocyanin